MNSIILLLPVVFYLGGMPVSFSLLAAAIMFFVMGGNIPYTALAQSMVNGVDSFVMLAVPLFVLAAKVMNLGKITDRLFDFAGCLVGHIKGGLAHVNILASLIFSGMSGSAIADASGLGMIEIHAMNKRGFEPKFSAAVTGASGCIGPIFPPSVPLLVYGGLAGVSISKLFLSGVVPGVLMALFMMVVAYIYSVKRNYPSEKRANLREIVASGKKAILPILLPVVILLCIVLGIATPTEISAVAVIYALILSFAFKTVKWRDLPQIFFEVAVEVGTLMFIIAGVTAFAWIITFHQIPQKFVEFVFSVTSSPNVIMLFCILILFIIGCFMNTTPGLIVAMPFLIPLVQKAGINLVQFGVVSVLVLVIGLMTPPVGIVLYIVARQAQVTVTDVIKESVPFILALTVVALIVAYFPQIVLFLPNLF